MNACYPNCSLHNRVELSGSSTHVLRVEVCARIVFMCVICGVCDFWCVCVFQVLNFESKKTPFCRG